MRSVFSGPLYFAVALGLAGASPMHRDPREGGVPSTATVRGMAFDSLTSSPLIAATVQLLGTGDGAQGKSYSATTDANGAFVIDGVVPGRYVSGFLHPLLDSLGLEPPSRPITVAEAGSEVSLATPSVATLTRVFCGKSTPGAGLVLGHVRAVRGDTNVANAQVTVNWMELRTDAAAGAVSEAKRALLTTGETGMFVACEVPSDVAVWLQSGVGADSSGLVPITVGAGGLQHVTLGVGSSRREVQDSTVRWRGQARLRGELQLHSGEPVANATITLPLAQRTVRTSQSGTFFLDSLPEGTHVVEITSVGRPPATMLVNLDDEEVTTSIFRIGSVQTLLPKMNIYAPRTTDEFLLRSKNLGLAADFLPPEELARRPMASLTDIVGMRPGVTRSCNRGTCFIVMKKPSQGGLAPFVACAPALYVNGRRDRSVELGAPTVGTDLSLYVGSELVGIEIYPRGTQLPQEFIDPIAKDQCGAIAVWTKK